MPHYLVSQRQMVLPHPPTSRTLSLNGKGSFSLLSKVAHSSPVTPIASLGQESVHGRHLGCTSNLNVCLFSSIKATVFIQL
ncbi:hypothetical protein HN51_009196 [Arachis hypogaea]